MLSIQDLKIPCEPKNVQDHYVEVLKKRAEGQRVKIVQRIDLVTWFMQPCLNRPTIKLISICAASPGLVPPPYERLSLRLQDLVDVSTTRLPL